MEQTKVSIDIEYFIKDNPVLYAQLCTGRKANEFLPGDIVKCSYLKGLYRVAEVFKDILEIYSLESPDSLIKVSAVFIQPTDISASTADILYSKKLT